MEARLADQAADGVDVELVFPNKGLLNWATPDPRLADAMCRAWNRWAYDFHGGAGGWYGGDVAPGVHRHRRRRPGHGQGPLGSGRGFVGLCLSNSPVYGPKIWGNLEYNEPVVRADCGRSPRRPGCPSRFTCRPATTPGSRWQRRGDHQLRVPLDADPHGAARPADHLRGL